MRPPPRSATSRGACTQATSGGEALEFAPGAQQLPRMRLVLGVVERDEFASGQGKCIGERLGLGARPEYRNPHHFHVRGQRLGVQRCERRDIVFLADQLYLELAAWPVDPPERRDEFRHHGRLAVERDEHGIDRQVRRRWFLRNRFAAKPSGNRRGNAQRDAGEEKDRAQYVHRHPASARRQPHRDGKRDQHRADDGALPGARHDARGQVGIAVEQIVGGLPHQCRAKPRQKRFPQGSRRHDPQARADLRMAGYQPAEVADPQPAWNDEIARRAVSFRQLDGQVPGTAPQEGCREFVGNDQPVRIDGDGMSDTQLPRQHRAVLDFGYDPGGQQFGLEIGAVARGERRETRRIAGRDGQLAEQRQPFVELGKQMEREHKPVVDGFVSGRDRGARASPFGEPLPGTVAAVHLTAWRFITDPHQLFAGPCRHRDGQYSLPKKKR